MKIQDKVKIKPAVFSLEKENYHVEGVIWQILDRVDPRRGRLLIVTIDENSFENSPVTLFKSLARELLKDQAALEEGEAGKLVMYGFEDEFDWD